MSVAAGVLVEVDVDTDTCTAGGVRLHNLHATSAPRRHDYHSPTLESYTFVPNIDPMPVEAAKDVEKYGKACSALAIANLKQILKAGRHNGNIASFVEGFVVDMVGSGDEEKQLDLEIDIADKHTFLSVLKEISLDADKVDYLKRIDSVVKDNQGLINRDALFTQLINPEVLKPCLDLVVENMNTLTLKVLEFGDTHIVDSLRPLAASQPLLHTSYNIAEDSPSENREGMDSVIWSLGSQPQTNPSPHLAILNKVLHKQSNIEEALKNVLENIEKGGFILVHEHTKNFHLALTLEQFNPDLYSSDDLSNRSCGIYCTAEKWREIFASAGCEVVFERSDHFSSSMFLLRAKSDASNNTQHVLNVSDLQCSWVEELKSKLVAMETRPAEEKLWLQAEDNITGIVGLVNCLRQEPGGHRVR